MRSCVLGTWYLVLGTWYLVLGTWYLIAVLSVDGYLHCTRYFASLTDGHGDTAAKLSPQSICYTHESCRCNGANLHRNPSIRFLRPSLMVEWLESWSFGRAVIRFWWALRRCAETPSIRFKQSFDAGLWCCSRERLLSPAFAFFGGRNSAAPKE